MKQVRVLFLFFPFLVVNAFAQSKIAQDFVIDQTKPYVYLKFDHIGPREPIEDGERDTGLWLRVVNNCRVPILLRAFSMPPNIPGVGLEDEVVQNEAMLQISYTPEQLDEIRRHEKLRRSKHMPEGYSFETGSIVRVQPGADLLFSVPLNHVDDDWYMRVKFALDLDKSSFSFGPFTYLPFHQWDIPKGLRSNQASAR